MYKTHAAIRLHPRQGCAYRGASSSLRVQPLYPRQSAKSGEPTVKESKLDSGVKVISLDSGSPTTTVSLYIQAGSRFESRETYGAAHFLQRLAFKNTHSKSGLRTVRDLEHIGTTFVPSLHRETLAFQTKGPRTYRSLDIAIESVCFQLYPTLHEWEIKDVQTNVKLDIKEKSELKNMESLIEAAHFEAFRSSGLGNSMYCPEWKVSSLGPKELYHHLSSYYFPGERLTIVGTGVQHDEFRNMVAPLFIEPFLKWRYREVDTEATLPVEPSSQSTQWYGGQLVRIPGPGYANILVSFPGVSYKSEDYWTMEVLTTHLSHHTQSTAFNLPYSDTGFLGIYTKDYSAPERIDNILEHVNTVSNTLTDEALEIAKNLVKVQFLSAVEDPLYLSRMLAERGANFADITSQLNRIGAVTNAGVLKVVESVLASEPVVVVSGDVRGL